jgi:hypothetical protein
VPAQIGVILYNPDEPRTSWVQSSCHQFNPYNLDWGWTNFHGPWDQIHCRRRGQRQALLRNDTLVFDAYIRVFDDPTKSLWWHASESEPVWDSLSLTGYRALGDSVLNHSAEVAGLAAWLHLALFRRIVQAADVLEHRRNCDIKPRPLCDALQKFLWRLRCQPPESGRSVDTDRVTATLRNLHEYSGDVSEFWERLRRSLELELAGTDAIAQLAQLFDSAPVAPSTPPVNHLPTELIPGIRVPADRAQTVQAAVVNFLEQTPGRWSLPPVLHVELSRQQFDQAARQWKLLYNRVDLDEVLDVSPYVVDGQCGRFDLYGFVVHCGRRTSGKFFSILRPGGPGSKWLAFDDDNDNRVECLTGKAALETHVGLEDAKLADAANDRNGGHDVAVAVLYVRSDVVREYLPGPLEPWEVPPALEAYLKTGSYPIVNPSNETTTVQVEIYDFPTWDGLDSLFDSYDLMSRAKSLNQVMYLTLPSTTTIAELRRKVAQWKSNGSPEKVGPERVRLWQVGQTKEFFGPTLVFNRIVELDDPLDFNLTTVRFWTHVLSQADAKFFALPDPPPTVNATTENKPEEAVEVRSASDSEEGREPSQPRETTASDSASTVAEGPQSHAERREAEPEPPTDPTGESSPSGTDMPLSMTTEHLESNTDPEADVVEMDAEATPPPQSTNDDPPTQSDVSNPPTSAPAPAEDLVMQDSPAQAEGASEASAPTEPPVALPVSHIYYFIQVFDIEQQVLHTVGSYFSRIEENIKSALRKHLGWPEEKDFLIWTRVDGTSVSTVSPVDTFWTPVRDGMCFVVGTKLTKDQRSKFEAAGLFSNPDSLVQHLWAATRNHPTQAFTGTKTIDATFSGDYYSGDFIKGCYHGKGTHISDSGTTFVGDFIFGQRHGKGKMEYPSGDTYEGDWIEDQRHGHGTFVERKTGNKYVGGYKNGKRHGKGVSYWEVADEEMDLCQICYGEEQDALFYDCGHVCACVSCARQVDICPICRKNVISVVKIFKT